MTPNEEPRARYHHGDLRNALIEAGFTMLEQGGATALDLRKLARIVGVSHAAPYRHFVDKQALIVTLIGIGFERLNQRIEATVLDVQPNGPGRLEAVAHAYVAFAHDNPWLMREMFSGLTLDRSAYPDVHRASKAVYAQFVMVIEHGQTQGEIRAGDVGELASVIWSLLHGMATLVIERQTSPYTDEPAGVERLVRVCTQMLYEGLAMR